jgi:serine/threonine-protein kinase
MDRIGRYKIVRELGRGAMGVVYHAIDPNIGRPLAIKTIRLGEVSNTQERARLRERLFREARSAGILSHPGIVTIYDVEQQGDLAYIAMEFVDGPTLDEVMSGPRALTRDQMFAILGQAAVALDYAHQKGIVHRDIKPANIMLTPDHSAKITDFGIAKVTASEQFTMTGTIVGTPHYMSPEQVQGKPVNGRADQFSLVVMGYEMLTGEKPFTGEQLTTVVYKIVAEQPRPAPLLNATLNAQVEAVLRKGLSKKPEARYRTCEEFVNELETACGTAREWKPLARSGGLNEPTGLEVAAPVAEAEPAARPALPEPRRRRAEETAAEPGRKRRRPWPAVLALIAVGAIGVLNWPMLREKLRTWEAERAPAKTAVEAPVEPQASAASPSPSPAAPAEPPKTEAAKTEASKTEAATEPANPGTAGAGTAETAKPMDTAAGEAAPLKVERPPTASEPPAPAPRELEPTPQRPPPVAVFAVLVATSPPGATVTLDGRAETACKSPCSVQATVGRHRIAVTLAGHATEHREVNVTGTPLELPLVSMRSAGGTLMISTTPAGASIYINGNASEQKTPAQIPLAAGTYTVMVEKDGRRVVERVEVRAGGTTYRRIPLNQ